MLGGIHQYSQPPIGCVLLHDDPPQGLSSNNIRSPKPSTSPLTPSLGMNPVLDNAFAGLSSGVTGTIIGYPLDLLKTRLQVSKNSARTPNNNIIQMSTTILKTEGIQGFFKGLMAPLVSISFLSTVTFASYSWLRPKLGAQRGWDVRNAAAATLTAPVMVPITTMETLVRTQMQMDNLGKKQYNKGSWHCLKTIAQTHGSPTLFTGMTVTVIRDSAFLATYFFVYEGMKATLTATSSIPPQLAVPLAGGSSGAMAWLVSFPFDCVRAGVQGQCLDTERKKARQVFQELMKDRGLRALYRGVSAAVARAFIVSSSRFSAYEVTLWLVRGRETE